MLPRVFVDANILIAGADSRSGASRAVLVMGEIGLIQLVTCRQVIEEAERNIRKKLPRAMPNFVEQMTYLNLEILGNPSNELAEPYFEIIEEKDAPILTAALSANVIALVTLNTKDFTPEVESATGLKIQTPAQFVESIRGIVQDGFNEA